MNEAKNLLNVSELAKELGVSTSWIYQRTRLGQQAIPFIKVGKLVRFDRNQVVQFFSREQADARP